MRRFAATIAVFSVLALCATVLLAAAPTKSDASADKGKASTETTTKSTPPADRVVVMYFHRTQRCPTCRRMGGYTEEAVLKGFDDEVKNGAVEFHFIDFQDEKNAALSEGYGVTGPTLIVAQVVDNKVKHYKSLTEIWKKNGDKAAFLKYVRDNVAAYRNGTPKAATKPEATRSARSVE
ncbi:MAG: nitrophenyl compound nitroreductase subunit ArsF family protein [Thermoguttaceae bacterium]